jgi:hypothetical protein
MMTTIQTHRWLLRGRSSARAEFFGGGGAGAGGVVAVVLGESLVLIATGAFEPPVGLGVPGVLEPPAELGALGKFGVLGGLSGNLKFLFSGQDLEPFGPCYRECVESSLQ